MDVEDIYERVAYIVQGSKAYRRHRICGTRNDKKYLKIVACKGMYFSDEDVGLIHEELCNHLGVVINHNKRRGIITINLKGIGVSV